MKNGLFEIGDRVDHKRLGYVGTVMAHYADGKLKVTQTREPIDPDDLTMVNDKAIQDAFDHGHKAAGGTQIPDNARDVVELALDRDQISALAKAAEQIVGEGTYTHAEDEGLTRFLETISIYRRKS